MNKLDPYIAKAKRLLGSLPRPCLDTVWTVGSSPTTLLITPPPTESDIEEGIPWNEVQKRKFFSMAPQLQTNLLIMPAVFLFDRKKDSVAFSHRVRETLLAEGSPILRVVCVGGAAFKIHFGFGKKVSTESLAGATIRTLESGFRPLYTFPDPDLLIYDPDNYAPRSRDQFIAEQRHQKCVLLFRKLCGQPLTDFLKLTE